MNYQLLAADMDGTLLNSKKEISPENVQAINRALDAGKIVIFSTGRCIRELRAFLDLFPKMRYLLGESGACIYDLEKDEAIVQRLLDPASAKIIMDHVVQQDIMPQVLCRNQSVMNLAQVQNLAHYRMAHYQKHFDDTGMLVNDVYEICQREDWQVEKICLYHTSPEARATTQALFEQMELPVVMALAEETSLEISPVGVDKGVGLELLCQHLGISVDDTIAVGDSFNDLSILKKAGLAVAVENAVEPVKAVCQAIVASNDQHGVKEAIEQFLLK